MKSIWKYGLMPDSVQQVRMPHGAKILSVQTQKEEVCLWAEVDTDTELKETRFIECFGTGQPMVEGMGVERVYIGTVQTMGGELVWHFYERTQ